jgi:hypothetical protein
MSSASAKTASADSANGSPGRAAGPTHGQIYGALAALLLAALIVPPFIRVDRFRRTLLHSIGEGLGRPVNATSVELRLLPLPSFVLHNFTVSEDPAFGAEPVLTAESVTVLPRASTLWHRRVEVATLSFNHASVNLVRNAGGHWNFEALLQHSPAVQRQNRHAAAQDVEPPMPFPYIEATRTRVNFKSGAEKLPLSLEEANLALWKESAREWRARVRARPVRTDAEVADAGQIRLQASLLATGPLGDSPLQIAFQWRKAPLEELGRLLHGRENGWRGLMTVDGKAAGSFSDLQFHANAVLRGFQRAEFVPPAEIDLAAACQGRYSQDSRVANTVTCAIPVEDGHLTVAAQAQAASAPSVQIGLDHVPASWVLAVFRQIHPGVAPISASGVLSGSAECRAQTLHPSQQACNGSIHSNGVVLQSGGLPRPLTLPGITLTATPDGWELTPLRLTLGGPSPVTLSGTLSHAEGIFLLNGPASLQQIASVARAFRIPAFAALSRSTTGTAQLHLQAASRWVPGFSAPATLSGDSATAPLTQWSGQATLQDAIFQLPSLPRTVHLTAAHLTLASNTLVWSGLNGSYNHLSFNGSLEWQPVCTGIADCRRSFDLHVAHLDAARLAISLQPQSESERLLHLLSSSYSSPAPLPQAAGLVAADTLTLGPLELHAAHMNLTLEPRAVRITHLSAALLGGTLSGGSPSQPAFSVRWDGRTPAYEGNLDLAGIRMRNVAGLWQETWGAGTADGHLTLQTHGEGAAALASNAQGAFQWNWRNGALPANGTPASSASPLAAFRSWQGSGTINGRTLQIADSRVFPAASSGHGQRPAASIPVTGTLSFARQANLHVGSSLLLTGPLNALKATRNRMP